MIPHVTLREPQGDVSLMLICKIQYGAPIPEKILQKAMEVLRNGGVVAHPTDTCYGFAVDIFNEEAVKLLYRLKKMSETKPVTIMVSCLAEAKKYGEFFPAGQHLAKRHWPGALTLIVPRKKTLPTFSNPHSETVGIRVPDCPVSLALIRAFGGPLSTTSANITTLLAPYRVLDMLEQFRKERCLPDLVLDAGEIPLHPSSTVVKVIGEEIKVVRQGKIKIDEKIIEP